MPSTMTIPFTGTRRRSRTVAARSTVEAQALWCVDNLYGVAVRLARTPGEAEDLVCETYARAFRHGSPPNGEAFKFLLFTILCSNIRSARGNMSLDPIDPDIDGHVTHGVRVPHDLEERPLTKLTATLSDADLKAALDSLPDSLWQALWLRDVENFSYAEIAQILSIPLVTVISRIGGARRLLYERLSGCPSREDSPPCFMPATQRFEAKLRYQGL